MDHFQLKGVSSDPARSISSYFYLPWGAVVWTPSFMDSLVEGSRGGILLWAGLKEAPNCSRSSYRPTSDPESPYPGMTG